MIRRHLQSILLLLSLALAVFVYFPGLSGTFFFDDSINITDNGALQIKSLAWDELKQAALSGNAGIFGRSVSMLSFAFDYYFHGLNPFYFKLTNLSIHLLNGICIYLFSTLLLDAFRRRDTNTPDASASKWISLAIATAWLVHPLNVSSVLYVVQRMTSLCALFTLCGLITYTYGRLLSTAGKQSGWGWILAAFVVFTPLAALSKENGALLPFLLLLTELVFFQFQASTQGAKRSLATLFGFAVVLPAIAIFAYTAFNPAWITHTYRMRDFTLPERLMSEARIVWLYMRLAVAPDLTQLALFHDDIAISRSLFSPPITIIAVAGIAALGFLAASSWRRRPILAFGILFYLLGHSMESSVLALELAHEHRNYLPMFGLLFPLFYYLLTNLHHLKSLSARRAVAALFIAMLAGVTFLRATTWGNTFLLMEKEAEHHPTSVRAHINLGAYYYAMPVSSQAAAAEIYKKAYSHYALASANSPSDTLGLTGLILLNTKFSVPLEGSWLPVLASRIEKYPFLSATSNTLFFVENCFTSKRCAIQAETVETLFTAAMRNPTLEGQARSVVLFSWADFLLVHKHQTEAARVAAYGAADAVPSDLGAQLNLIVFLINMHKYPEALVRVDFLRHMDKLHLKTKELDGFEKMIHNRQKKL
jgi:protein O-mannosyl-transferase